MDIIVIELIYIIKLVRILYHTLIINKSVRKLRTFSRSLEQ